MSHILDKFARVSEDNPCPKCGYPDWCLIRRDGKACVCQRVESGKPYGQAGWFHYLPPDAVSVVPLKEGQHEKRRYLTHGEIAIALGESYKNVESLIPEAARLGVSFLSLCSLRAGVLSDSGILAFPMWKQGRYAGVRYRRPDGSKWSLKGGSEGLFVTSEYSPGRMVFSPEGPTDAAALHTAGLINILARPNCSGGGAVMADMLREHPTTPIVFLADPDQAGINGAINTANKLPNPCLVITGPTDIRDFVRKCDLPEQARCAIIEGIAGTDSAIWRQVARNRAGATFNFGNDSTFAGHFTTGNPCSSTN